MAAEGVVAERSRWRRTQSCLLFALVMAAMGLNVLDGYFTLIHLERGANEANPVMDRFLAMGMPHFMAAKVLFLGACLIVFCAFSDRRSAMMGIRVTLIAYVALHVWHWAAFQYMEGQIY